MEHTHGTVTLVDEAQADAAILTPGTVKQLDQFVPVGLAELLLGKQKPLTVQYFPLSTAE